MTQVCGDLVWTVLLRFLYPEKYRNTLRFLSSFGATFLKANLLLFLYIEAILSSAISRNFGRLYTSCNIPEINPRAGIPIIQREEL